MTQPSINSTDEQKNPYSPEIRSLAYAMESMTHLERCAALIELADEQHRIGIKNGRMGYIRKQAVVDAIGDAYPYAITDMERYEHQNGEEPVVIRVDTLLDRLDLHDNQERNK